MNNPYEVCGLSMMKVLVFTTVYPNREQPNLGVFVRERISRVAKLCQIKVVAPVPYFPFAGLIKKKYGKRIAPLEVEDGIEVYHPKFFLIPGMFKFMDGVLLYLSAIGPIRRIQREFDFDLIDAHFVYPDGFAATLLGKRLRKPVTVTLRGTLNRLVNFKARRPAVKYALQNAAKVFSVSAYLVKLAENFGIDKSKFSVIPNGVDPSKFQVLDKVECRKALDIHLNAKVIVSVGSLVERKGHHRLIEVLPDVMEEFPDVLLLIVGGPSAEGDITPALMEQVKRLKVEKSVRFSGEVPHGKVNRYLCAADIFALATRYEGWANVFLEAMSCGVPVVTTDVCGNAEVVKNQETGLLVPFGDVQALKTALERGLQFNWDREKIMDYARGRTWGDVAHEVYREFERIICSRVGVKDVS